MQHSADSTLLFFFHHLSRFCLLPLFVTDHDENHTHTSSLANSVASPSSPDVLMPNIPNEVLIFRFVLVTFVVLEILQVENGRV
jgi:hypothetical protein